MRCVCLCSIFPFSSLLTKVLPQAVSEVTVIERQSNKLILSWTPGHDVNQVSHQGKHHTGLCNWDTVNSPDHWLSS